MIYHDVTIKMWENVARVIRCVTRDVPSSEECKLPAMQADCDFGVGFLVLQAGVFGEGPKNSPNPCSTPGTGSAAAVSSPLGIATAAAFAAEVAASAWRASSGKGMNILENLQE